MVARKYPAQVDHRTGSRHTERKLMTNIHGFDRAWPTSPNNPTLSDAYVDVWRLSLDVNAEILQRATPVLSDAERQRAQRLRCDIRRNRFISRHAALRTILSRYVGTTSQQLRFNTNVHGKPHLKTDVDLRFNTSHSGAMALVAVTRGHELGIDIECLTRDVAANRLARRFFSPAEADVIERFKGRAAISAFFACWTLKEAYVKARGMGLTMGLNSFEVSIDPLEPVSLLRADDDPENVSRWSLSHLVPGDGYLGALAVEGRDVGTRQWHYASR